MSDNKALADRPDWMAEVCRHAALTMEANGLGNRTEQLRNVADQLAALSPQADKARGEVDWRSLYRIQTAMRYMDNMDDLTRERAFKMADDDCAGLEQQEVSGTPQPQGDAIPQASDVPFSVVRKVVDALSRLGVSAPEGHEEQAARAVELIGELCDEVLRQRSTPQVSGGGEALAVAAAMLRIAPTCESDWDEQLREWASRLSSTPQARPDGGAVEPIGWVFQHDETGRMSFCPNDGVNTPKVFAEINPRHTLCGPAYTHPTPAPDVARLVDAMKRLDRTGFTQANWDYAMRALAPFTAAQQETTNGQE